MTKFTFRAMFVLLGLLTALNLVLLARKGARAQDQGAAAGTYQIAAWADDSGSGYYVLDTRTGDVWGRTPWHGHRYHLDQEVRDDAAQGH